MLLFLEEPSTNVSRIVLHFPSKSQENSFIKLKINTWKAIGWLGGNIWKCPWWWLSYAYGMIHIWESQQIGTSMLMVQIQTCCNDNFFQTISYPNTWSTIGWITSTYWRKCNICNSRWWWTVTGGGTRNGASLLTATNTVIVSCMVEKGTSGCFYTNPYNSMQKVRPVIGCFRDFEETWAFNGNISANISLKSI